MYTQQTPDTLHNHNLKRVTIPTRNELIIHPLRNDHLASHTDLVRDLRPEGFTLRSHWLQANVLVIASNGLPLDQSRHKNTSLDPYRQHYGAIVGAYAGSPNLSQLNPDLSQLNPEAVTT